MIAPLQETLAKCIPLVPADQGLAALLRPDLVAKLATRLLSFEAAGGPIDRPEPHFDEEVTPPLAPVFDHFRPVLAEWQADREGESHLRKWADVFTVVGMSGTLL